jgi:glycerate 2-kinase
MLINQPITKNNVNFEKTNQIIMSALDSVDPEKCVRKIIGKNKTVLTINGREFNLKNIHKIYIIGVGKAVLPMAFAVSDILGELLEEGVLITKHENLEIQSKLSKKICVFKGSHPIPDKASIKSTEIMLEMLNKTTSKDLVIGLISGGGSALMTFPDRKIGLLGVQHITSLLLKCGATIEEMNTIRKHLDQVKGGGLLKFICPAKSIHLILSDVLGDPLSMIASGPTSADSTTFKNCLEIIHKYDIEEKVDTKIMSFIKEGVDGLNEETIKLEDPRLADHKNVIVGSLSIALKAAYEQAIQLGFEAKILTSALRGEARIVGADLANQLIVKVNNKKKNDKPVCLIAGGETTVTVKGHGFGGRNQELALSAAQILDGVKNCAFISFATDGEDGPTDAAGGMITGDTYSKGIHANLDIQEFLRNNNTYEYLGKVGSLIKTGPTGTNVNDLILMFAF